MEEDFTVRGKKLILMALVTAVLVALPAVVYAAHTSDATGRAQLHPENQSGIVGTINFTDDGGTLSVSGTAGGMDPAETYFSLIYDIGSAPGGPEACEPTIFNPADPNFILPTMFVGVWSVDAGGNGTLTATNTNGGADYVPLTKIKTISVRRDTFPENPPFFNVLDACGQVATHPAG